VLSSNLHGFLLSVQEDAGVAPFHPFQFIIHCRSAVPRYIVFEFRRNLLKYITTRRHTPEDSNLECVPLPRYSPICVDSSVGIGTGYGLDGQGVGVPSPGKGRTFSCPRSDRFWGPPSLLSNGYRGSFPGGKAAGA
jgi:hypothetical protein